MLPGFRFLFAAIALSVSILVFGLGAAALLRAAHEEFSSNSSWRAAPEPPMVAQQPDASRPTLAMLRFDPPPGARETATDAPTNVVPAGPPQVSPASSAPAEPEAVAETPPEPQKVAALKVQETSAPIEPPKPDAAKVEPAPAPAAIPGETTKPPVTATDTPATVADTKIAPTEETKPVTSDASAAAKTEEAKSEETKSEEVKTDATKADAAKTDAELKVAATEPAKQQPATSEAAKSGPTPPPEDAARKVATLGGSPVATEEATPKKDMSEKAERSAASKARARAEAKAERAKARRRLAAQRARLARQRAQQQPLGLFGQQTPAAN